MTTLDLFASEERRLRLRLLRAFSPAWLVVSAGVVALLPAVFYGIPSSIDLLNHFRFALPFYDALQQGNLHPSWLAESNFGLGDASFRFYPPALYYLLALGRAATGSWYAGTMSTVVVLSVAGCLGVYCWAKEFLPKEIAMWAGVFYSIAPYHTNQLYQSFLLAEFAGAAVLPFAFAFVVRVCRRGFARDVAGLAFCYALLILTHLPLTVIGSVALGVYALACLEKNKLRITILKLTSAVLLALVASSYYWTTMLLELKWIRAYDSQSVQFSHNFIFSTLSPDNLSVWWMNILLVATLAMFWPAFAVFKKSNADRTQRHPFKGIALLACFSVFMATPLSLPLWQLLSPLRQVQFPWRWLSVASMAFAVLLPAALPFWYQLATGKKRFLTLIAGGTFSVALAFSISHTVREAQYLNSKTFDATLRSIPGTQGVWQWWPIWVHTPFRRMTTPVETGSRTLVVDSWEPEKRVFHVSAGEPAEMRVRTFFYPHWIATANGAPVGVRPDKDGALLVSVPADDVVIDLEFKEPLRAQLAVVVSIVGLIVIAGLAVFGRLKKFPTTFQVR